MLSIRSYSPGDAPVLLEMFLDTIRRVNSRDYSPEQIRAWASDEISLADWSNRFSGRLTMVAELDERLVGFADLEPNGHIDRFFVSADHQRCGVGRMLLAGIFEESRRMGLPRLSTEASITARPFFQSHGFQILAEQVVTCRGSAFVNYRMERVSR